MIEKQENNRCAVCSLPKTGSTAGSITQWISTCRCSEANDREFDQTKPVDVETCANCRKPINASKTGTITQFLFSENSCKCEQPRSTPGSEPDRPARRIDQKQSESYSTLANESYLEVDPNSFPVERYKPIRVIGKGALGEVYLCRDALLGKKVAVKCLLNLTAHTAISFQNEAKIASKLSHESVISILDFGTTAGGRPFMVMEYFPGKSLQEILSETGKMDEPQLIELFLLVCNSLQFLHESGVLHRDLKPSNILVCIGSQGEFDVRLIDFNLSKTTADVQTKTLVGRNTIVGTPGYMSPDLIKGEAYSVKSEVYSLGCVMFEALTGSPPYRGETALELLNNHVHKAVPSVRELRPEISDKLCGLIGRCMSKAPGERFASMLDVVDELEKCKQETNVELFEPLPGEENTEAQVVLLHKPISRSAWIICLTLLVPLLAQIAFIYASFIQTEKNAPKGMKVRYFVNPTIKDTSTPYMVGDKMTLRIAYQNKITPILKKTANLGVQVQSVIIFECKLTTEDASIIASIKPNSLKYSDCNITNEILAETSKNGSLRELRIMRATTPITLAGIDELRKAENLNSLEFNECELTDEHLKRIKELKPLRRLFIYHNDAITLSGIKQLGRKGSKIFVYSDTKNMQLSKGTIQELADCGINLTYSPPRPIDYSGQFLNKK